MRWNLHSNAGDVLSLGPRTAGQLATVGVRSVAELLAAQPHAVAQRLQQRSLSAQTLVTWQCEARLILALPQLPATSARLLAAAGISSPERIRHCTPTELFALLEAAQQSCPESWLAGTDLPSIAEISEWIRLAQLPEESFAA